MPAIQTASQMEFDHDPRPRYYFSIFLGLLCSSAAFAQPQAVQSTAATVPAATAIHVDMTSEPPSLTEAQKALFEAQQGRRLPHATPLPVTVTATPRPDGILDPARATRSPSAGDGLKADGDFTIFRNQDYGGTIRANTSGATGEPNVVNNGPIVFSTGNWWAAISANGGQTFSYISPYTMFPASFGGFCCDQTAVYDEARDIFIWTLQYISSGPAGAGQNLFRVAVARPAQAVLGNWFYYDFVSASNTEWDFPGSCVSNNFLYHNTNRGAYNSGSVNDAFIFKFPLASLATGAALSYQFLDLGAAGINNLSLRCTTGATDVMYFGAHNSTSQIEVFKWGDSTGTVFRAAVNLSTAWPNATRVCPTPDGRDWCGDDDGRMKAGWIGRGLIGFMWNASAGLGFVNPYVEAARLSDGTPATGVTITPTYVDRPFLFNGTGAFQYPGAAANARGDIGITRTTAMRLSIRSAWWGSTTTFITAADGTLPISGPARRDLLRTAGATITGFRRSSRTSSAGSRRSKRFRAAGSPGARRHVTLSSAAGAIPPASRSAAQVREIPPLAFTARPAIRSFFATAIRSALSI
jgi:hypothetical protein